MLQNLKNNEILGVLEPKTSELQAHRLAFSATTRAQSFSTDLSCYTACIATAIASKTYAVDDERHQEHQLYNSTQSNQGKRNWFIPVK